MEQRLLFNIILQDINITGGIGNHGPHINVRPIDNIRTGPVLSTFGHYEF